MLLAVQYNRRHHPATHRLGVSQNLPSINLLASMDHFSVFPFRILADSAIAADFNAMRRALVANVVTAPLADVPTHQKNCCVTVCELTTNGAANPPNTESWRYVPFLHNSEARTPLPKARARCALQCAYGDGWAGRRVNCPHYFPGNYLLCFRRRISLAPFAQRTTG